MSAYRKSIVPQAKMPPRAPWWRLLRASMDGTLNRVLWRQARRRMGVPYWARRVF